MTEIRALRIALIATGLAVAAATFLLIKETAYNFVLFMFLSPPLLLVAAAALGWVIYRELRTKKVF
jgi:hypothetical protein